MILKKLVFKKMLVLFLLFFFMLIEIYSYDYIKYMDDKPVFDGGFYFYNEEKFSTRFDQDDFSYIDMLNKFYFNFEMLHRFYTFDVWANEVFIADFYRVGSVDKADIFFNYLACGVDNYFDVKKNITFYTNIDFTFTTEFNKDSMISVTGYAGAEKRYYFGFDWCIEQSFPVYFLLDTNDTDVFSSTYVLLGYEFFRFYGPEKFRFGIETSDIFDYSIRNEYIQNYFKAGIYFKFFGVKPVINFIMETCAFPSENYLLYNYTGIDASIKCNINRMEFSVGYTGKKDITGETEWQHIISSYVKIILYVQSPDIKKKDK